MAGEGGGRSRDERRRRRRSRIHAVDPEVVSPADVRTRSELGVLLEQLRSRSGRSLRELSRRISESSDQPIGWSALGEWCRGARLPLPSRYDAFRRLLELLGVNEIDPWIDAVVRVRASTDRRTAHDGRSPYMGLKSFGRDDAGLFFGRRELIHQAITRFRQVLDDTSRPRALWVVGASGAGKSSLLHAGVCPALEGEGYRCLTLTPGPEPASRLAALLDEHCDRTPPELRGTSVTARSGQLAEAGDVDEAEEEPPAAAAWVDRVRASVETALDHVVLVIDQFEELFRQCEDEWQRQAFTALLATLTGPTSGSGCVLVAGLRIEFFSQVATYDELVPSLQDAQLLVTPLNRAQLRDAIVEPARQAGVWVDEDLVSLLLRDFVRRGSTAGLHDHGALPLLSHALDETWSRRADGGAMTIDDYNAVGGIGGAIEASAERVYEQLAADDQALVRQVFLRLVHVEEEGVVTRRAVSYSELEGLDERPDSDIATRRATGRSQSAELVDRFVDARLLTARETTVEIVHESLPEHWPRLREWIEQDREALRTHRRITDATRAWIEHDRDPEVLAGGARLESMQALAAAASVSLRLNQDERDFLAASHHRAAERERARRRQTRRLRVLASVAATSAVAATALAVTADRARDSAAQARDEALSRQTALNAEQLRVTDPGLAAQLAVAGYEISPTVEARSAVLAFASIPRAVRHIGGEGPTALAIHPDGSIAAVSNAADGTVRLLVRSGGAVREVGILDVGSPDRIIHALTFTPDGNTLFTGDTASDIRIWDTSDPAHPREIGEAFTGPTGTVERLVVSPDGGELLAGGADEGGSARGVHRWDISVPSAPREMASLPSASAAWSMAYDDEGGHLAVGNETGQVELWNVVGTPQRVALLEPTDQQPIFAAAYSPDGGLLAAGSQDSRVRVWDVSTPSQPQPIEIPDARFDSWVNTVAFSPDGQRLLAGSSDQSVRIWEREGSSWIRAGTLPHPAEITNAVFVDDGRTVLSTATDGTSRWWDIAAAMPLRVNGRTWGLSFDRTGRRFAMVSNNEARVWDVSSRGPAPEELARFEVTDLDGADDGFSGTGFLSPDGRHLAIGTRSTGEVYLVDLTDPGRPRLASPPLGGAYDLVESVPFSPDGSALAAGGDDSEVRLWALDPGPTPRLAARLDDPTDFVLAVTWSPDGRHLAVASADGAVYLYDVADLANPTLAAVLAGLDSEAYIGMFTPDGTVLAVAGSDGIVVLWDISDPGAPRRIGSPLTGPEARIFDLAFDSTGRYLAAAASDGTTWLWDTNDVSAVTRLAVLGPAESAIYQVEFDPIRGDLLASGADGVLYSWPPNVNDVIDAVCATSGDNITSREWRLYLQAAAYDPPCADRR